VARVGLRWGRAAWLALAASCAFGTFACSDEDEPDNGPDAAVDARRDTSSDLSVGTDSRNDTSVADQRDTSTTFDTTGVLDVRPDGGGGSDGDGGAPDTGAPDGGNCVGGGDAARDGLIGMMTVQALNCANCHQEEPGDAGLFLSGKLTTIVADAAVFPRNLTPDPTTGLGCWTDQQIVAAIMDGVNERGMMLCSRMPRFAAQIDAGAAQEIVNFLRTLPAVAKAIPETTVCPPRPPRPDGGADADGGAPPTDAGTDSTAPDSGTDGTPPGDAGTDTAPPDGGPDSAPPDGGPDAGIDADLDVATDVDTDGG
jgi:hypothetical protein